jgi:hypothetical protein
LTPEQCVRLLQAADPEDLPAVTLGHPNRLGLGLPHSSLQEHYKFPPLEALSTLTETAQNVFSNGSRIGIDFD